MGKLKNLEDVFHHELKDLYSAEKQILAALPKMIAAASHDGLKKSFRDHEQRTQEHLERLKGIGKDLGVDLSGHKCKGIEGILKEGEDLIKEDADPDAKDAGLIGAAQRVEHYEMAGYGTARTFARRLGHGAVADLLQKTLDEEGESDKNLTRIAEGYVNQDAVS